MSGASSTGQRLVECLGRISALLETGDVTGAAALMEELNALTTGEPESMTAAEQEAAGRALGRCVILEDGMRQSTLEALRRLGATRRSHAYGKPQEGLKRADR